MRLDDQAETLNVPCSHCGARIGGWCRDFAGAISRRPHMKRVRAAAAKGLLSESVVATEKHRRR